MDVALKNFGILGIALLGLVIYLSTYVLGFYFLFYVGLVGTFAMLILVSILAGGKDTA